MLHILHISDLHLRGDILSEPDSPQGQTLERLQRALVHAKEQPSAATDEWIVVVSGDIFDTASLADSEVGNIFDRLLGLLDCALGSPTVLLLPGNHDVRFKGVFRLPGIWPPCDVMKDLAQHLRDKPDLAERVVLYGNATPRLLWSVSKGSAAVDMVAYDSTYLPYGVFSAGGMIRAQDLLSLLPKLGQATQARDQPPKPLVLLLHHHLIPTPVADFTLVQNGFRPILKAFASNSDYEEVMQTALGAGSALSGLQRLGRPVLVLHGHKHYPSVRLLKGVEASADNSEQGSDLGDILLLSAGSAGLVEEYRPGHGEPLPIWPSFNHVKIGDGNLESHVVVYPPTQDAGKHTWVRPLFSATYQHLGWQPRNSSAPQTLPSGGPSAPQLARNASVVRIGDDGEARRSLHVERTLDPGTNPRLDQYAESIDCAYDAIIFPVSGAALSPNSPLEVLLPTDGTSSYEVANALYAYSDDFAAAYDKRDAPFESIELLNRYAATKAELSVAGLSSCCGVEQDECFASVTDLTLGTEKPVPLVWEEDVATLAVADCPARHRLRIYWPLATRPGSAWSRRWRAVASWCASGLADRRRPGFHVPRWLTLVFCVASLSAVGLAAANHLVAPDHPHFSGQADVPATALDPSHTVYLRTAMPLAPFSATDNLRCQTQQRQREASLVKHRRDLRVSLEARGLIEEQIKAGEPNARQGYAVESAEAARLAGKITRLLGYGSSPPLTPVLLLMFLAVPIMAAYALARHARRAGISAGRRTREVLVPFARIGVLTSIGAAYVTYLESLDPLKDAFDQNSYCLFSGSFWPTHLPIAAAALVVSGTLALAWVASASGKVPSIDLAAPNCGVRRYLGFLETWCFVVTLVTGAVATISLAMLAPSRTNKINAFMGIAALAAVLVILVRLIRRGLLLRERYRSAVEGLSNGKDAPPDPTETFLGGSRWKLPTAFLAAAGVVQKLAEWFGVWPHLSGP